MDSKPFDEPKRCPRCGSTNTRFVAHYAAPGYGQAWTCSTKGHTFAVVGGRVLRNAPVLDPEDVV